MSFEEFQDGLHLGYLNVMILAILTLHVATMAPTKFQLNPGYWIVTEKKKKKKSFNSI